MLFKNGLFIIVFSILSSCMYTHSTPFIGTGVATIQPVYHQKESGFYVSIEVRDDVSSLAHPHVNGTPCCNAPTKIGNIYQDRVTIDGLSEDYFASLLPAGFCDSFERRGVYETLFPGQRTLCNYRTEFSARYQTKASEEKQKYARAHMRSWANYHYAGFRAFIKELPGYEEYMLVIAAQLKGDAAFAQRVRSAEKYAYSYILREAARIRVKRACKVAYIEQQRIVKQQEADTKRTLCQQELAQEFLFNSGVYWMKMRVRGSVRMISGMLRIVVLSRTMEREPYNNILFQRAPMLH